MIINKMENGIWTSIDTERNEVLCTINRRKEDSNKIFYPICGWGVA